MNDLARAAGLSPAYLYTRFDNKQALLDHVIGTFLERQESAIKLLFIQGKWEQGLEGRLRWLARQFQGLLDQHRGKIRALTEMHAGDDAANAWLELTTRGYVRDWLLACADEIRHSDPLGAVTTVLQLFTLALQSGAATAIQADDVVRMALLYLTHPYSGAVSDTG